MPIDNSTKSYVFFVLIPWQMSICLRMFTVFKCHQSFELKNSSLFTMLLVDFPKLFLSMFTSTVYLLDLPH